MITLKKDVLFKSFAKRTTFVKRDMTIHLFTGGISLTQGRNVTTFSIQGAKLTADSIVSSASVDTFLKIKRMQNKICYKQGG